MKSEFGKHGIQRRTAIMQHVFPSLGIFLLRNGIMDADSGKIRLLRSQISLVVFPRKEKFYIVSKNKTES